MLRRPYALQMRAQTPRCGRRPLGAEGPLPLVASAQWFIAIRTSQLVIVN